MGCAGYEVMKIRGRDCGGSGGRFMAALEM